MGRGYPPIYKNFISSGRLFKASTSTQILPMRMSKYGSALRAHDLTCQSALNLAMGHLCTGHGVP